MFPKINPVETQAWTRLCKQYEKVKDKRISELFTANKNRFNEFSILHNDLLFDYSKNNISEETRGILLNLAEECKLNVAIEAMFSGEKINETENRAVLHTALRSREEKLLIDNEDVITLIEKVIEKMKIFCNQVHSGSWTGYSGKKITDVVNIGIGGSDLGPVMVTEALRSFRKDIRLHFVSNVDASHLLGVLKNLDPATTLFLVASKTFTTRETMANAFSARKWFLENGGKESFIANHFAALSTNEKEVNTFGIPTENMFEFWDWVGGRYSLWSAAGLSISLAIGYENYEQLLQGANDIDIHFRTTPFEKNIPVMMALTGIWNRNFCNYSTEAILPYNQHLHRFPAYFQQGNMESNGKSVDRNGQKVSYNTGPVIWGEPGTNGQHAFFQLLHQGTEVVPCDFIACAISNEPLGEHHEILLSNFFAQTEALMNGAENNNPHRDFRGNRPTNSFLLRKLNPFSLGQLIALYEHKIFVQGVIWNIYSFDQFGVELGKVLANKILPELKGDSETESHDGSTNGLINTFKKMRK